MKQRFLRRKESGFTLIELLIVIAIIGILAAIAIPNLLNALQRGKQKRTMADIRNLATAIESYNVDNNQYPNAAGTTCPTPLPATAPAVSSTSWTLLRPTYIAQPPFSDAWGNFLLYGTIQSNGKNTDYLVASPGKDGQFTNPGIPSGVQCGTTTSFNADIVYSDGTFIVWPEGPQQ